MPDAAELESALGIAWVVACRYLPAADAEDAAQLARIDIFRAWGRYEPARGTKFSTFAWHAADGAVRHYLRDHDHGRSRKRQRLQSDGEPVPPHLLPPLSLEWSEAGEAGEEPTTRSPLALLADPRHQVEDQASLWVAVRQVVGRRLARLLRLRCEGWGQAEVGRRLGYSQYHISRLEGQALRRLRGAWGD